MWPEPNSASRPLFERALKVMVGGTTRHVPWQDPYPVFATSCNGMYITDADGTRVLDLVMNNAALIHGHAHPRIVEDVRAQLGRGTACTMPFEVEVKLAEIICDRVPSIEKVRFCNSGSEGVMIAIKAARAYTNRPKIVKIEGIYHGSYDYAEVSLDPKPADWGNTPAPKRYARGVPQGVLDDVVVVPWNQPEALRRMVMPVADQIAAIMIDPCSGGTAFTMPTEAFLEAIDQVAREIGALVIYDEVLCFRLGYHGAQGVVGRQPDLTVLAKVIGGGFPVGAVGGRSDVMEAVFEHRNGKPLLPASGTFTANPITMTAGIASMELLDEAAFERLAKLGDTVRATMRAAFAAVGVPGQVRGEGSLLQVQMHDRPIEDYRSALPRPAEAEAMKALQLALLKRGVLLAVRGTGYLADGMTDEEIALIGSAMLGALEEIAVTVAA